MDQLRSFYFELQNLDRRQLISIDWLKRWCISLFVVFVGMNYLWRSIFSGQTDSHIPHALQPKDQSLDEFSYIFQSDAELRQSRLKEINFVTFACVPDDRWKTKNADSMTDIVLDTIRTMKSAAMFSKKILHFHIFTEDRLFPIFIKELDKWPNIIRHRVNFKFHPATYPEAILREDGGNRGDASSQKACDLSFLFLPSIVKDLDYVIYSRSGTVFLNPIDDLWHNIKSYDDQHNLALPLSGHNKICKKSDPNRYNCIDNVFDSSVIQYDVQRLQTGIFSVPISRKNDYLNATLLPINVEEYETADMTWNPIMLLSIHKLFKKILISPGKDIMNIIAIFNPHKVFPLPCEWNFRLSSSCASDQSPCPNCKLVASPEEDDDNKRYLGFEQLCRLIDNAEFDQFNLRTFKKKVHHVRQSMYKEWPVHNLCSLRNIFMFEQAISN